MADTTSNSEKHAKLPQILAGLSGCLASFATGTAYGWSSPVGVKLTSSDPSETPLNTTFSAESDEIAWISSLLIVGILATSLGASYLADKIGRKWTLIASAAFYIIPYILFMFAYQVWVIYLGRVIQGFGAGFVITTLPLYIGEIATKDIRGAMGSFFGISLTLGILFVYAVGAYSSYYALQGACLSIPIIFAITFYLMPESPFYLVAKGNKDQALISLKFLRHQPTDRLQDEITMIQDMIAASPQGTSILNIFRNRSNLKAFLICVGLVAFQQLSGLQSVLFNAQIIFEKAHSTLDSGLSSIIVGLFQFGATCATPVFVDRFGRKVLLLASAGLMTVGLIFLGLFFYLDETGADTSDFSWLPLVSLIFFVVACSIGLLPVPFAIFGEIFPPDIKFNASAILAMTGAVLGFAVTRFYPAMAAIGLYFPFWVYSGLCVVGFMFVLFAVIETKGLSLMEIQDKLNN